MAPEQAISSFASAVLSPRTWPDALESVAQACGAVMVTVVNCTHRGQLTCSSDARHAIDMYLHDREVPDTRIGRVNPTLDEGFRTDYDDFEPNEIARDPYYQEFLAPLGVRWHATAALCSFDERIVISLKRSPRQGPFERVDIDVLNRVLPHFRAAAHQSAITTRMHFEGQLDAFATLNRGALWLDDHGRILACNGRVSFGDGLVCDAGHLSAAHADDRTALARVLQRARTMALPSGPVIVRRPSGKRPYMIDIIRVPAGDIVNPQRTRFIALVNDLEPVPPPRCETLQLAFGFTPREAELAAHLCRGATVYQAAARLGISEQHARQRLKSIMAKTETSRQQELIGLLLRLQ